LLNRVTNHKSLPFPANVCVLGFFDLAAFVFETSDSFLEFVVGSLADPDFNLSFSEAFSSDVVDLGVHINDVKFAKHPLELVSVLNLLG
jgi:hypothetical protein